MFGSMKVWKRIICLGAACVALSSSSFAEQVDFDLNASLKPTTPALNNKVVKELTQKFFDSLFKGNPGAAIEMLADDLKFCIGDSPMYIYLGCYYGKDWFGKIFAHEANIMTKTSLSISDIGASEDTAYVRAYQSAFWNFTKRKHEFDTLTVLKFKVVGSSIKIGAVDFFYREANIPTVQN